MKNKLLRLSKLLKDKGHVREANTIEQLAQENIGEKVEQVEEQIKDTSSEIGNYFNLLDSKLNELETLLEAIKDVETPDQTEYQVAIRHLTRFENLANQMGQVIRGLKQ